MKHISVVSPSASAALGLRADTVLVRCDYSRKQTKSFHSWIHGFEAKTSVCTVLLIHQRPSGKSQLKADSATYFLPLSRDALG